MSRVLAIDVGKKRVGLARTDLLKTVASPFGTYDPEGAIAEVARQIESEQVDTVVVGWPLEKDDSEGRAVKMVNDFLKKLHKKIPSEIPVIKIDERYTSVDAVDTLIRAGVPKTKRREKARVDRVAAALILEEYLNRL